MPFVTIAIPGYSSVSVPAVGDDHGSRLDVLLNERSETDSLCVCQRRHSATAQPSLSRGLNGDPGQYLPSLRPPPSETRLLPTNVRLVNLYAPRQSLSPGSYKDGSESVKHSPRSLVRADLQGSLETEGSDPVLAAEFGVVSQQEGVFERA